jgi:hypothetical protein
MDAHGLSSSSKSFSEREELVIHVAGANVVDMIGIIKWEFLHHRLPKCAVLRYVFVGPELEEEEDGESAVLEDANCQECKDKVSLTLEWIKSKAEDSPDLVNRRLKSK